jgi:Na+-transporting methylmalonyl-CoA/oxaloacetate decarboxylase gamma subunit
VISSHSIIPARFISFLVALMTGLSGFASAAPPAKETVEAQAKPEKPSATAKPEEKPALPQTAAQADSGDEEEAAEKKDAESAAVALPVSSEPVQVYGWR